MDEKEYLVIPDVHGQRLLLEMILKAHPDKHYIFLGDLIDRGDDSKWCLRTAVDLRLKGKADLCIGNHELMAWMHFNAGERNWWTVNGLPDCKRSWDSEIEMKKDIREYMELASHYHIIDDMLFAHAGVPLLAGSNVIGESHLWDRPTDRINPVPTHILRTFHGHTPFKEVKFVKPDNWSVRAYFDSPMKTIKVMNPRTLDYWVHGYSE